MYIAYTINILERTFRCLTNAYIPLIPSSRAIARKMSESLIFMANPTRKTFPSFDI